MPTNSHLIAVAQRLKQQINIRAFRTIERTAITAMLREVSGEPTTCLKANLARGLTKALGDEAVLVYPPLDATTTGDTVRLCNAGSVFSALQKLFVEPDAGSDRAVGDVLRKVKGQWEWRGTDA